MSRWMVGLTFLLLAAGCQPRSAAPALVEYRDAPTGFVIQVPAGWTQTSADAAGREVRFFPPDRSDPQSSPEFIAVFVTDASGPLDEPGVRRLVFSSLPIHGVSGFLQDPRSTPTTRWDKFEVTGSSGGVEWASVGVVVSGAARTYLVVCAKPFAKWREGQKQCDDVTRTFQPGRLSE